MAAKLPFIKWFPADWMADTVFLSPATRGIWFDLLNSMWLLDRVEKISGTLSELARAGRCDTVQMQTAIDELTRFRVANVIKRNDVVTLVCRRFQRERKERVRAANGMRVTRQLRKSYGNVTRENTEDRNSNTLASVTAGAEAPAETPRPARDSYPQSIEEVMEIAADPRCAEKCTREQARDYFLARDTRDWVDARGRQIKPGKVYGDLKIWLLRDKQEKASRNGGLKERTGILADQSNYKANERGAKK